MAVESYYQTQPSLRKRTLSGSFADSINPLMTFSSEDLATMVGEVKDDCNDSEEDEGEIIDEVDEETTEIRLNVDPDQSTSSSESLAGNVYRLQVESGFPVLKYKVIYIYRFILKF